MIFILHRNNAPISAAAWEEIDDRAKEVIENYLSARRVLHVEGPKGWNYTAVSEGRLTEFYKGHNDVEYGKYLVKPLVEGRIEFELDRFELDNVVRGAKDVELGPLEEAVKKLALFEENAIYKGLENGEINGLLNDVNKKVIQLSDDPIEIMDGITEGIIELKKAYAHDPYSLVVGKDVWKLINRNVNGTPIKKNIENLLGTKVVYSHVLEGALLLPFDHEDLELTIGQDFTIGYQQHDNKKVKLYVTESFTYRTLDENIIIQYSV